MTGTYRTALLLKADTIVNGARADVYGGPEDSFVPLAKMWGAFIDVELTAPQVALMLAMLKIVRLKEAPTHEDSFLDLAGYAACAYECMMKQKDNEDV